jgi:uncharacterized protein YndB with AHSA1/START domain
MTVTAVDKDAAARTMTLTAEFAAPAELVWSMIADPRRLERWWGPPGWPASFEDYSLTPGEFINYAMTGPAGEKSRAWFRVLAVDAPRSLDVEDGFTSDDGTVNSDMPSMTMRFDVSELGGGRAQLRIVTTFPSNEAMEQLVGLGMEEGMTAAAGQLDALIAEHLTTEE